MTSEQNSPAKFRVNPVEILVFAAVSVVFGRAVYDLFEDRSGAEARSAQKASPLRVPASRETENRNAATGSLLTLEVNCDGSTSPISTQAARVRLTGSLCGGTTKPLKAQVMNQANRYQATVFTDLANGRFSTDYIPLASGQNGVVLDFSFSADRQSRHELTVVKE